MRFHELVVRGASSEDDVRRNAGLKLANPLHCAFALFRGWCSVRIGGSAKNNDDVKVCGRSVLSGNASVNEDRSQSGDDEKD